MGSNDSGSVKETTGGGSLSKRGGGGAKKRKRIQEFSSDEETSGMYTYYIHTSDDVLKYSNYPVEITQSITSHPPSTKLSEFADSYI